MTDSGPLDGIEVLELGSAIAGPFGGRLLADNGANVTRIEPLWGTTYRNRPLEYDTHGADSLVYRFMAYNTSKDSIAVDLKSDAGAEILWELVDEADVLLENMRPGVMDRLGFGWDAVHERNPELIYCSVTGFGDEEPYASWPAHDTSVLAISGMADQVGELDRPERMDVFAIDHATAMYATIGILMALVERGVGGQGQLVEVAMYDVALSLFGHQFGEYSGAQADPDVEAVYGGHFAPNDIVAVADGYLAVFVPPEAWDEFCAAVDRAAWADPDHRYGTVGDRVRNRIELREDLESLLADRTAEKWVDYFAEHVPVAILAPATPFAEVPDHPLTERRGMALTREQDDIGEYTVPGRALRFSRTPGSTGDVPHLGEDTDEILGALGYSAAEVDELREQDVVR
jgi:crotonobetainyl-CoA:carnitine CoA-transferase CaiB-like acyl-CoA transferase